MSDELPVHLPTQVNPLMLLQSAIEKGIDPEKLGKLMDLVETWNKNRAAEAFANAIRDFQSSCPAVEKSSPVRGKKAADGSPGPIHYHFAPLEDVMEVAQPHLTACGIVVTWDTCPDGQSLKTTCHVRVGTHVEHTSITIPCPV